MKVEIKSRWNSSVLFVAEAASLLLAVEAAVRSNANLSGANLYGANLSRADLYGANLSGADLSRANLYGANLYGAKNRELIEAQTSITSEGNIVGWKKCQNNVIVKLLIPQKARRSNATGRKCRAEYVKVLQIFGAKEGVSIYDVTVIYRKGATVKCSSWEKNRFIECGGGIHFYLSRIEAENHR